MFVLSSLFNSSPLYLFTSFKTGVNEVIRAGLSPEGESRYAHNSHSAGGARTPPAEYKQKPKEAEALFDITDTNGKI